jgi:hypothetical protein
LILNSYSLDLVERDLVLGTIIQLGGARRLAKQAIAQREQQVVALRLRHHSFTAIGRVVGISRQNAQKAFARALRRNTAIDIHTIHRSELAELELEAAAAWELADIKDNPKARAMGLLALNRIHLRRARLLGLDAPVKLDVSSIYQRGGADHEAEQRAREAVIEALPIADQRYIYEMFYQAGLRAKAGDLSQLAIATTVINGSSDKRTDDDSQSGPQ